MKMTKFFFLMIIILLFISGCGSGIAATTKPPRTVINLPMGYIPNVQFAPYYVAKEKGYFRQVGIDLNFDYSSETDGVALVGANQIPFSTVSGEQVLLARAQGLPVVYVMAWWHGYPVGIISSKNLRIKQPSDLKGVKIGLPGLFGTSYIGLRAMLSAAGLEEKDVILDSIGYNQIEAFISGRDQAVVIYTNNEPFQLTSQGYSFDLLRAADYVSLASNGLLTNESTIRENPELVKNMIAAFSRGISFTLEHPDEAFEICKIYVEGLEQTNQEVQKQILAASMAFWKTDKIGYSEPEAWENMQNLLLEMGMLKEPLDIEKAYSNEFLTQ
jgi:NitT/TauT family transport system substrate-binding protein